MRAHYLARSKVTAQGQISIPIAVRRKLAISPGTVLEWVEDDDRIIVRRAGGFSSEDIHRALFGSQTPCTRSIDDLKEGTRRHVRNRHTRG